MASKLQNQKGFATLEAILILVVVAIVAGTGYYIYNANKKATNVLNSASKVAKGSGKNRSQTSSNTRLTLDNGKISFVIPASWQKYSDTQLCTGVDNSTQCFESYSISPLNAVKASTSDGYGASVQAYNVTDNRGARDWFFNDLCGCLASPDWSVNESMTNGYDSLHAIQTSNSYTDDWYVFRKDNIAAVVYSRVKGVGAPSSSAPAVSDNTKYQPEIDNIAKSLRIQ